jgi:hypothetical protein
MCSWVLEFFASGFSQLTKQGNICMLTNTHIIYTYTHTHLQLFPPVTICIYIRDVSRADLEPRGSFQLPPLVPTSVVRHWLSPSVVHLLNCLIPDTCWVIVMLPSSPSWEVAVPTRAWCWCTASFSCTESTYFCLGHHISPTLFNEVASYICNTVLLFCHILYFVLGSSVFLNAFF